MTTGQGSRVLVLALGRDPLPSAVTEAALGWEASDVSISVVTLTPRDRLTATAQQLALLGRPAGPEGLDPSTTGEPRSTTRKALRKLHLNPVRWAGILLVLLSPRARRLVSHADVVLAADPASIPLGWVLAHRRGEGQVFRTASGASRALNPTARP